MTQVFSVGHGLQPIREEGLERGDWVRQAHTNEPGVVTGWTGSGYRVVFANGLASDSQRLGSISPYTRISRLPLEKASEGLIADLETNVLERRRADAEKQAAAATAYRLARAEHVKQLEEQYPNRVKSGSPWARGAANLRMELKAAFPGVKFSVTSSSYAGGCSIDVHWKNGPETDDVRKIARQYVQGSFDGMQDLYTYNDDPYSTAHETVLGGAKYVCCHREQEDE